MNARTQQLLDEVLGLPAADRAIIADRLEASLEEGEVIPEGVAVAWEEEAERRLREIESGAVKAIPANDVHRQLREKFGLDR
jgi:putative addiction module component (TIGR02574 family)